MTQSHAIDQQKGVDVPEVRVTPKDSQVNSLSLLSSGTGESRAGTITLDPAVGHVDVAPMFSSSALSDLGLPGNNSGQSPSEQLASMFKSVEQDLKELRTDVRELLSSISGESAGVGSEGDEHHGGHGNGHHHGCRNDSSAGGGCGNAAPNEGDNTTGTITPPGTDNSATTTAPSGTDNSATNTLPPGTDNTAGTVPPAGTDNGAITSGGNNAALGGNFTVSADGGFVSPSGQPWVMSGLNAGVQDALSGYPQVLNDFPNMTAIRLNVDPSQDSAGSIDQVVQDYTSRGLVVMLEDHSGNPDNVAWYQQMAQTYKNNPDVFLEMPNEPSGDANTVAQNQIGIIQAIRSAGYNNPIGVQPVGGYDQSNLPIVTQAVGSEGLFATPHIYYSGTDPNGAAQYAQSEVQGAQANGMFAAIDEFGPAMDGFTWDPQGSTVDTAVINLNKTQGIGAIYWAMDNGNHADGADSALANPDGSALTSEGTNLEQNWLG